MKVNMGKRRMFGRSLAKNIELGRKIGGFLSLGYPIYGCFIRENPKITWMMNRGSPILGNPQVWKLGTRSKSK